MPKSEDDMPRGLTDIHCHILPYVDDGSDDEDETRDLIAMQSRQGVDRIIITPHLRERMFETSQREVDIEFERLREYVRTIRGPRIYAGRENHCDHLFLHELHSGRAVTLAQSEYILIEFARHGRDRIFRYVNEVLDQGLVPVIAHVERYPAIWAEPELAGELAAKGALLQMNCESVMGLMGRRQQALSMRLLEEDVISFMASDAHHRDYRVPDLGICADRLAGILPQDQFIRIFYRNPERIFESRRRRRQSQSDKMTDTAKGR